MQMLYSAHTKCWQGRLCTGQILAVGAVACFRALQRLNLASSIVYSSEIPHDKIWIRRVQNVTEFGSRWYPALLPDKLGRKRLALPASGLSSRCPTLQRIVSEFNLEILFHRIPHEGYIYHQQLLPFRPTGLTPYLSTTVTRCLFIIERNGSA